MNDLAKNVILWIVVAVVLWSVVSNFGVRSPRDTQTDYSTFLSWVRDGSVKDVLFEGKTIHVKKTSGDDFVLYNPETSNEQLIGLLDERGVKISGAPEKQPNLLVSLFISSFPILLLIGVWIYFMRQMQGAGGGRGAMSFG